METISFHISFVIALIYSQQAYLFQHNEVILCGSLLAGITYKEVICCIEIPGEGHEYSNSDRRILMQFVIPVIEKFTIYVLF